MSQSSITQQQLKDGTLTFIDYHRPAIEAGTYKLTAQQHVNNPDGDAAKTAVAATTFVVDTPRFALKAGDIKAHYPPTAGSADYDGVVPSISFSRPTLPWERSPDVANNTPDGASWLALVLVDAKDVAAGRAREAFQQPNSEKKLHLKEVEAQLGIQHLDHWKRYDPELPMNILELQNDFYRQVLPTYGDLQWLSHTRKSTNKEGESTGELIYVLGNRMPSPNAFNTVYLVSIEHRYADTKPDTPPRLLEAVDGYQRLVFLHKWEFICKPGIMYNYTVSKDLLLRAKDRKPDIQLPEVLPDWVGHDYEGLLGREELRDILLNTYEISGISEAARNDILQSIEKLKDGEKVYQLNHRVLKKAVDTYGANVPVACTRSDAFKDDSTVRPYWIRYEFKGDAGRQELSDLLDGKALVQGITTAVANWLLKKAKKAGGTFDGLLDAVEAGSFHERPMPGKPIANESATKLLASGRTILRHHLRSGGKTFSWYKGPLSPNQEPDKGFSFPVSTSDALLSFNTATGMFDTTYAAAWNLGRLKGLENKAVATSLYRWRHDQRHVLMQQRSPLDHGHLHLVPPLSAELPDDVMEQIESWKRLQDIPFNYLVPKASLLPEESLRFFHVDTNWVRALLDGFFSVGKVHGLDDQGEEYEHFPSFDRPITGILLRSDAVAGWASMHVDAHAQRMEGTDFDIDPRHQIPVIRKSILDNELLFMLFDGVPKTIDIYLSPEALHSGFTPHMTEGDEAVSYVHPICHPATGEDIYEGEELVTITAITPEEQNPYRIFYPSKVKERIQAAIRARVPSYDLFELTPGLLGLELIEGTPMVRFQLEEQAERLVFVNEVVSSAPAEVGGTAATTPKDDLTKIKYIGKSIQQKFYDAGITTYTALAEASIAEIGAIHDTSDKRKREWKAEARKLAG
ncbi:MAG: helix-hairpin-helix domain-containing protein [Bacteroidota bacterium]